MDEKREKLKLHEIAANATEPFLGVSVTSVEVVETILLKEVRGEMPFTTKIRSALR